MSTTYRDDARIDNNPTFKSIAAKPESVFFSVFSTLTLKKQHMGKEIERKFLLDHAKWHQIEKPPGTHYRQGYLFKDTTKTIRVRLSSAECTLTIKGPITGISRDEYEYEIPAQDALEMIENLASTEITKIRYKIHFEGKTWEVDEFLGENSGLFIAEIELEREDEVFSLPAWVTEEVTGQKKYYNYNLSVEPFKQWP